MEATATSILAQRGYTSNEQARQSSSSSSSGVGATASERGIGTGYKGSAEGESFRRRETRTSCRSRIGGAEDAAIEEMGRTRGAAQASNQMLRYTREALIGRLGTKTASEMGLPYGSASAETQTVGVTKGRVVVGAAGSSAKPWQKLKLRKRG